MPFLTLLLIFLKEMASCPQLYALFRSYIHLRRWPLFSITFAVFLSFRHNGSVKSLLFGLTAAACRLTAIRLLLMMAPCSQCSYS